MRCDQLCHYISRDFHLKDWFKMKFVPSIKEHLQSKGIEEKAALLLDNCPAHPPADSLVSRCGKVNHLYLPKNTTSKIQPMDQGVISTLKQLYRKKLIMDMVSTDSGIQTFLKQLTLKDVIYLIDQAWKAIKESSVKKCWTAVFNSQTTCEVLVHYRQ